MVLPLTGCLASCRAGHSPVMTKSCNRPRIYSFPPPPRLVSDKAFYTVENWYPMDSVSITDDILKSLSKITKAAEDIPRLATGHDEWQRSVLIPARISLQKYQVWQKNWSGVAVNPDVSAKALWSVQGWRIIRGMLDKILKDSDYIGEYLDHIRGSPAPKPRSKWKTAVMALRSKQQSSESLKELQKQAAALSASIDQLWIYSETVFDSLHGILAHETKLPEREKLLTLALHSRAGSLVLHTLCSNLPVNCCLEIRLLGPEYPPRRLFYHLLAQVRESPKEIQEVTVESIPEPDESELARNDVVESNDPELQLFKPQSGTGTKRIVTHHGSNPPSRLLLPPTVGTMSLETKPERLADFLTTLEKGTNFSTVEHFSMGAKVELAYQVIECGFFLIGTPWFSSLSSKNILRLRRHGQKRHNVLEVQTVDPHDLLFDDPGALAETSQLFRIGILLMEIALGEPNRSSWIEDDGHDVEWISKLPLIEQSMGIQYCKATAFCLQHRQPKNRFRGPEKYQSENFVEWESYLAGFLLEYHSQVFLRYAVRAVSKSQDELWRLT